VAYLFKVRTAEPEKEPLLAKGSEKFLGNGSETNNGTTSVARQQITNNQQVNSNKGTLFSVQSVGRCFNRDGLEKRVECSVESQAVMRRQSLQLESPLLKSVDRKRLVETVID
jgi:hypothetical protein